MLGNGVLGVDESADRVDDACVARLMGRIGLCEGFGGQNWTFEVGGEAMAVLEEGYFGIYSALPNVLPFLYFSHDSII